MSNHSAHNTWAILDFGSPGKHEKFAPLFSLMLSFRSLSVGRRWGTEWMWKDCFWTSGAKEIIARIDSWDCTRLKIIYTANEMLRNGGGISIKTTLNTHLSPVRTAKIKKTSECWWAWGGNLHTIGANVTQWSYCGVRYDEYSKNSKLIRPHGLIVSCLGTYYKEVKSIINRYLHACVLQQR